MLHTLHSLAAMYDDANIVLSQQHYNIFDTRMFKSNESIDDTFISIKREFIRLWTVTIKPFIDAFMHNDNIYKVNKGKALTLTSEEGIYLGLRGLDSKDISYFYAVKGLRLMCINTSNEDEKDHIFYIFNSPVYDPLHKTHYSTISIIFYKNIFNIEDSDAINRILLRIVNEIAITFIDDKLMNNNNVLVNRVLAANVLEANKDVILLPELFNISDTKFIFNYFYTLFSILISTMNTDFLNKFEDYSNIISLPEIFTLGMTPEDLEALPNKLDSMTDEEAFEYIFEHTNAIYKKIWNLALHNYDTVDDSDYISICIDIMKNLAPNIDQTYYDTMTTDYGDTEE